MCFIVGMGRSGTTLLTNLLNQHPEIIAMPENNFILFGRDLKDYTGTKLLKSFEKLQGVSHNHSLSIWHPKLDFLSRLKHNELSYSSLCKLTYLESCMDEKINTVRYIIDKNPVYSLYISELKQIFPEAKFIVISRDPRDNYVSRKKHTKGIVSKWTTSLANSWKMYYDSILKSYSKNKEDFHFVRYEDLSKNSLNELTRIQDFLETKIKTKIQDPDHSAVEGQLYSSDLSAESKEKILEMHQGLKTKTNSKRVSIWKEHLTNKEIWYLTFFCRKIGKAFGYELNYPKRSNRLLFILVVVFTYPIHILTHQLFYFLYYQLNFNLKIRIFK